MRRLCFLFFKALVRICSGRQWRRVGVVDWAYRLLFNWLRPDVAHVHGHRMYVDPNDRVIARGLLLDGTWEPFETELFQKTVKPGMVVCCLGAHIGYYVLLAARLVGTTGRVYAFEPHPDSFRLLVRNIEANGYRHVVPVPQAVARANGRATLYLNRHDTGDHRLFPDLAARPALEIETVRLDDWMRGREELLHVIQMDIQGAEMAAVEGMEGLLRRSRVMTLFTELWPEGLKRAGASAEAYLARLADLGFQMHVIDEESKRLRAVTGPKDLEPYRSFLSVPNHSISLMCYRER